MKKAINFFLLFALFYFHSNAQELNCRVAVNAEKVQTSDRRVFTDMETAFAQFMNSRTWTPDFFKPEERINCNILITINEMPSIGSFTATVQIQASRPIYNSSYESSVLNFADRDWNFQYVESLPMDFSDNTFLDNLSSLLAFYAYIIIGLDYDSFSELGGTPYFQKALNVVNNAQTSNNPGWNSLGNNRNRYNLIDNILNPTMLDIRKHFYSYHRLGLDLYESDPDKSREEVLLFLKKLNDIKKQFPTAIYPISIIDSKVDELVNVFSEGNLNIRKQAYDLLLSVSPKNKDKFDAIIK